VTHLPQVAAQGHQHLRVAKLSDGRSTRTSVAALSAEQRVDELARMLGGVEITPRARAHAQEMLAAVAAVAAVAASGKTTRKPARNR
jgi:DNA repair protein RecN (Recombination protein N)